MFLAFVADPKHAISIEIVHHRDVLGTLAELRLIDPNTTRPLFLTPGESSPNGPVLDPDHVIAAERKLTRYRREAGFLQPVDDQGFEERYEPRLWIRPRNRDLDHSMLVTLDSGNGGHDKRAMLHGVQVTQRAHGSRSEVPDFDTVGIGGPLRNTAPPTP